MEVNQLHQHNVGSRRRRMVWWRRAKFFTGCRWPDGGSGWIYTESTFNTWKSGNPTDANNWLLNSEYYLTNASTIAGNSSFPSTSGGTETGHSGDGYARITSVNN